MTIRLQFECIISQNSDFATALHMVFSRRFATLYGLCHYCGIRIVIDSQSAENDIRATLCSTDFDPKIRIG